MYRIDKSLIDHMSTNKSYVVIRHKGDIKDKEIHAAEQNEQHNAPPEDEQAMLQDASEQASSIIDDAIKEAEEIKQAAWQEGFAKGKEEADQRSAMQAQSQVKMVMDFLNKLKVYKQNLRDNIQNSILELSLDIAEKIINMELKRDDKVYVGIIKKAIARLEDADRFKLRVSRSEYEKYFKNDTEWFDDETGHRLMEVICDPHMLDGECIVESDQTIISAGVPLQFNKIKRLLSEEMEHGQAG